MTPDATQEALEQALADRIDSHFDRFPSGFWTGAYIAGNLMRSVLAPLLADLQRVTAERDEALIVAHTMREGIRDACDEATHHRNACLIAQRERDTTTADAASLRERLEIAHAYDGAGTKIPFPEGMEHLDGIACRDETIRNLEEQAARLRAENEKLKQEIADTRTELDALIQEVLRNG